MIKVIVAGATGYTGVELIRLLIKHPEIELVVLTSETYEGKCISEVFPALRGWIKHKLVSLQSDLPKCDYLFLALPHTTAMDQTPQFLERGIKVIDLSADFRIHNSEIFEQWYHIPHKKPEYLEEAVYGLPELHREKIRKARLVANPGCYPTSVILGIAPLTKVDWVDLDSIIADSKSGVSGAGRKENLSTQFSECNDSISAYNLGKHRHTPEIEQEISALAGRNIYLTFSPHLTPMTRGILSTIYINLKEDITLEDVLVHFQKFYESEPFIRVLEPGQYANTHYVIHSNCCDLGLQIDIRTRKLIITSAIDNLIKGASGQAVQNLNIMLGVDEKTGLDAPGIFP